VKPSKSANEALGKIERLVLSGKKITFSMHLNEPILSWPENHAHRFDNEYLSFAEWVAKVLPDAPEEGGGE
jgi:hypothetical protein